jgi:hypothetical protein
MRIDEPSAGHGLDAVFDQMSEATESRLAVQPLSGAEVDDEIG